MRPPGLGTTVSLAVLSVWVAASCSKAVPPPSSSRPSVVLISLDTFRADHVGVRGLTPALDAFAKKSAVFSSAWSHAPLTLPAHSSLLTGLLPPKHGVQDNLGFVLTAGETLAERFSKAGYSTGAFVSSTVLRRGTGAERGFGVYDDEMNAPPGPQPLERTGAETVARALRFVETQGTAPFFLFVHLYDAHTPYAAPAAFRNRGANPYDQEIAATDAAVGTLLEALAARGLQTAIAITADHGEGLGDHGEDEHGLLLYSEVMRVPLFLSWPDGSGAGTRVDATVRHIDVAPTLLTAAGLTATNLDGTAITPGTSIAARPAYAETWYPRLHFGWSELRAAAEGRWRYIEGPKPELYDLSTDPREMTPLPSAPGRPAEAMARFLSDQRAGEISVAAPTTSREAEERLRALGYLGSRSFASNATGANPKDKITFYRGFMAAFTEARDAQARGDFPRAVTQFRRAIALVSGEKGLVVPRLHAGLGDALARLDRFEEAEAAFRRELAIDPASIETRTNFGTLLWSRGKDSAAREAIAGIVEKNPRPGATEYQAVIRAFEVLGDVPSVAAWRERARAAGVGGL